MANPVAIESSNFALWAGKQTARGTPAVTADKLLRQVDGNIDIDRTFGNENFGDGARYSNAMDSRDSRDRRRGCSHSISALTRSARQCPQSTRMSSRLRTLAVGG